MRIGNRIFPYPVLNRNEELSDYVLSSRFNVQFEVTKNSTPIIQNGEVIFKNLHFNLTDNSLASLLELGKVKGAFILECSASVYRSKFDITSVPQDLHISVNELNGNVVASCYLYAAEDISDFRSEGFISDYANYSFDIDKFDILAVDDGFKFKIEMDPAQDDKVASIFTVVKQERNDALMSYANKDKNIVIYLPAAYYDYYNSIKMKKEYNNIAFAMLAIPVLTRCLEECAERDSIQEILDDYSWFNAVLISYKRMFGKELIYDDYENFNKLELAQMVLNSASCNGLKDFGDMLLGNTEEGEDDE